MLKLKNKFGSLRVNRTQSRVVIGLLTGHNTLRRHLYVIGLSNNPICRKCGSEEKTSVHVLCACEALASLRHSCLGSLFLEHRDTRKINIVAIWNFAKGTGLLLFSNRTWGIKACPKA